MGLGWSELVNVALAPGRVAELKTEEGAEDVGGGVEDSVELAALVADAMIELADAGALDVGPDAAADEGGGCDD